MLQSLFKAISLCDRDLKSLDEKSHEIVVIIYNT